MNASAYNGSSSALIALELLRLAEAAILAVQGQLARLTAVVLPLRTGDSAWLMRVQTACCMS